MNYLAQDAGGGGEGLVRFILYSPLALVVVALLAVLAIWLGILLYDKLKDR